MAEESELMQMEAQQMQLPPQLEKFLDELRADRKRLLKDQVFEDPKQLRQFVGQFLLPRIEDMFRTLAGLGLEAYGLAASNTTELRRLHAFTVGQLNDLGADLSNVRPPGVSPDVLNAFNEAFYALGTLLSEKYPEDKDTEEAYNRCEQAVAVMVKQLMESGGLDYDDDYDDEDLDDEDLDHEDDDKVSDEEVQGNDDGKLKPESDDAEGSEDVDG